MNIGASPCLTKSHTLLITLSPKLLNMKTLLSVCNVKGVPSFSTLTPAVSLHSSGMKLRRMPVAIILL